MKKTLVLILLLFFAFASPSFSLARAKTNVGLKHPPSDTLLQVSPQTGANVYPPAYPGSFILQYDEQIGLTFTQDSTTISYGLTAVPQVDQDGYGPGYFVNGLTYSNFGPYYYRFGLFYNWYGLPGWNVAYFVWGENGGSELEAGRVVSGITVSSYDQVKLTLYDTNYYSTVWAEIDDLTNSGYWSEPIFTVFGGQSAFKGLSSPYDSDQFFTGVLTDWMHLSPYYGNETAVTYQLVSPPSTLSALSSAYMWIDEYNWQTPMFSGYTQVQYGSDPTKFQKYALEGTAEYSDATQVITGNLPSPSVSISPSYPELYVGQPQVFSSSVTEGTPPYTYQWYLNGAPVSGATSSSWTFTPSDQQIGYNDVYLNATDNACNVGISSTSQVFVGYLLQLSANVTIPRQTFTINGTNCTSAVLPANSLCTIKVSPAIYRTGNRYIGTCTQFVKWVDGSGELISTNPTISITLDQNTNLTAIYHTTFWGYQ